MKLLSPENISKMDKKTGIRKDVFNHIAPLLTTQEIQALRICSPRLCVWGFDYFAKNKKFDLEKSDHPWSLIIEEKLKIYS